MPKLVMWHPCNKCHKHTGHHCISCKILAPCPAMTVTVVHQQDKSMTVGWSWILNMYVNVTYVHKHNKIIHVHHWFFVCSIIQKFSRLIFVVCHTHENTCILRWKHKFSQITVRVNNTITDNSYSYGKGYGYTNQGDVAWVAPGNSKCTINHQ